VRYELSEHPKPFKPISSKVGTRLSPQVASPIRTLLADGQ
jgi:hypothetical protein